MTNRNPSSRLSTEELDALQGSVALAPGDASPYAVDTWFKYRNAYLVTVIGFYVVKLLFFTDETVSHFAILPADKADLILYIRLRALGVVVFTGFYVWSYLTNWKFEKVALTFAIVSGTLCVMDYFNAYIYLHEQARPLVSWLLGFRLLAVICLGLNANNAARAPLMPRSIWK